MSAHPLHDVSPVVVRFSETLFLRWTGAAYLAGFLLVFVALWRQAARGQGPFEKREVPEFVLYAGLFGVMLGGRLGYMLLHQWEDFSQDLSLFFQFRQGGASMLGALLGVLVFGVYFARKRQRSWLQVTDALVVFAPLGFFLGHAALFAEGAPLGEVTSVPWAWMFPSEVGMPGFHPVAAPAFDIATLASVPGHEVALLARSNEALLAELYRILPARHPVLLYQAALEGVVLGGILLAVRRWWRTRPEGMLSGLFFVLLGGLRLISLPFQAPQPNLSFAAQFEQSALASVLLMALGAAFLLSVSGSRGREGARPSAAKLEGHAVE
ncbi:prolipoprotein diacylglyceryl transferase [Myxococcus stipitatus DSM 14675]|uniref:Prolipoprotein diacylglyceryl transferase n=1 Tax=Myxococcus stipitatus (strain DSM 14675 / JCM 12634 / Mx s8) TaxID=1278073 RepID=L7UQX2_MYXSD|nr:prolipoprotein diacylglyceryl transferase [Myxococcus stipitatus]AGC48944.1 prolipoprotein diacylglyceryl transferase [Myxococcus stipitatus DSM 14675]